MKSDQNAKSGLPRGWVECSIGQMTLPVSKIDPKGDPDQEIDYIDIASIDNSRQVIGKVTQYQLKDAPSRARQIVRSGDVLFATVRPYLRNIASVPKYYDRQIASTGFSVLRPAEGIYPAFLFYKAISRDFVNALTGMQYGVSYPAVKDEQVRDQLLWLPPLHEQIRIVAKIEELFSELDKGIESLKAARAKLNVYRQAVLKHAFEGKLTAQWREENKDKLETPEQLLAHIKQEREARYQQQLQEWKAADTKWQEEQKDDYRPNKPRKLSNLVTIAAKKNEVTPKSWLSLKIDGVCDIIDGDRGPNYPKKDDYLPDGYCLFLNAKNVTKKGFVFDECQFISEERHRLLRKGGVEIGDIIFTSRGTIGNVALHSSALDFGAIRINSGMFILRNYSSIMIDDYFTSLLISPIITKQIKRLNSGTAQPQLPIREFKQFVIPVPPIPEQEVIVRTIEAQMSSIDAIESDLARQLSSADALRQSILTKAFSGQLVPQNPDDEPASSLLERIKAEKAARSQNNTRAKRRRTTAAV